MAQAPEQGVVQSALAEVVVSLGDETRLEREKKKLERVTLGALSLFFDLACSAQTQTVPALV